MTTLGGEGADHTLAASKAAPTGEGPKIYAVSNLKAYLKPGLEEELAAPMGPPPECRTEIVCSCVPADSCACNTVSYHVDSQLCPGDCPSQCQCEGICQCNGYFECLTDCPTDWWSGKGR